MKQLRNLGDQRQTFFCAYCGSGTKTRDHVPPKVFLDEPYPDNLPVVPACESCNKGSSLDEEYVACLVECARVGSVANTDIQRGRVRRILQQKPALLSKLSQARQVSDCGVSFSIEGDRVRSVVIKLGRGHAAFELNEPQLDEPHKVSFVPFASMSPEERHDFEMPPCSPILPEVGSRAMQRLVVVGAGWIEVQPRRYRYLTSVGDRVVVWTVIDEYLACEVMWG